MSLRFAKCTLSWGIERTYRRISEIKEFKEEFKEELKETLKEELKLEQWTRTAVKKTTLQRGRT